MKFSYLLIAGLSGVLFSGCSLSSHDNNNVVVRDYDFALNEKDFPSDIKNAPETTFSHDNTNKKLKNIKLLNSIDSYVGKKEGGDCSGFVSLINKKNNRIYFNEENLLNFYSKRGLKSEAIFNLYEKNGLIFQDEPKVGDLIFFNNTTNNTKKLKNKYIITHVGIITDIGIDGTIKFIHNMRSVNKAGFINLNKKNTHKHGKKEINSYVVSCKNKNSSCLSSNRFAGFGRVKFQ